LKKIKIKIKIKKQKQKKKVRNKVDKKYHKRKTKISEYTVRKGKRKISFCIIYNG